MDAVKGELFTRLTREIIVAAREGGGNIETNARLRQAVEKAREASLPQENIRRAIQRGTGELPGVSYDRVIYEGYGPGGVAVLVEALTDNRNRTVSELRSIFSKAGGNLGEAGCVAWMFEPRGVILISADQVDEDKLTELALEAGALDIRTEGKTYEVVTAHDDLDKAKQLFVSRGIPVESAEINMIPHSTVPLTGREAERVLNLMEQLEEQEGVQRTYANFDIPEAVMEAVA
jgi:YebC/PmpR family DNA-binding regulatory protein